MKSIAAALAAFCAISAAGSGVQAPVPPPKELKLLNWMKGEWSVEMQMFDKGKPVGKVTGTTTTGDSMNGMYLEARYDSDMGGMEMKGLQLTSYDPDKKQFMAFWFDSMSPGVLEMRGSLRGQTLILTSKMSSFPGMPGKMAFRSTNSLKGPGKLLFRLELNTGSGWSKMLEGTMTRK